MRKNFLVQQTKQQRKKPQKSDRGYFHTNGIEEDGQKYRQKSFDGLMKKYQKSSLTEREKNKSVARAQDARSRKNIHSPCFNQSPDSKQNLMGNQCGNLHEQSTHYQINIKKPLINLKNKQRLPKQRVFNNKIRQKGPFLCKNHPQKFATFELHIESEVMRYCGVCSVKLASQGFLVNNISNRQHSAEQEGHLQLQKRKLTQQEANKMMMMQEFLNEAHEVQQKYEISIKRLQGVKKRYEGQIRNANSFYQNLISFVKAMEVDHLNSLKSESRRDSQIGMIQFDYLQQNVEELSRMWEQIDQNFHDIMTNLDHQEFNDGLKYYISKVQVYKHKIEEIQQFFQGIPLPLSLKEKVRRVKQFLGTIWKKKSEKYQFEDSIVTDSEYNISRFTTKTNQTQILIKPAQFLNQFKLSPKRFAGEKKPTPFRVLFEEQDSSKEQHKELNQEK